MNKIAKLRILSALIQQCRCFYCGLAMIEPALPEFTPKELKPKFQKYLRCTAEHLTARQDQGRDSAQNIVAACWWCNTRRHKGREENAPNPQKYRQRVQSLMKKGRWHPVSAIAAAFRANAYGVGEPSKPRASVTSAKLTNLQAFPQGGL